MTVVTAPKKDGFFFSEHATAQLKERSSLTRSDVIILLRKGLYVPVGQDKHRSHCVIHSTPDNYSLVIIFDERNKEIVTVLYSDYNNRFVIDPHVEEAIKKKTVVEFNKIVQRRISWIDLFPEVKKAPKTTSDLKLMFVVEQGEEKFEIPCLTLRNADFAGEVSQISKAKDIKQKIEAERKRRRIEQDSIVSIITRTETGKLIKLGTSMAYSLKKQNQAANKKVA
jgi:hypothetical protein